MTLGEALFVSKLTYLIDSGSLVMNVDIVMSNDSRAVSTLIVLNDLKKLCTVILRNYTQ